MLTAQTGTERFNIPIIALQTVAANLGSAMTPLGNPQNLYLYSLSGMGLGEFLRLMAPVTGLSLVLLSAAVLCLPCRPLGAADIRLNRPDRRGLLLWGAVFAVCLLSVLRVLHYGIALGAAVLAALLADRRLLRRVDYSLLLTFLFFFVFVGNMKVLPTVSEALSGLVAGREMTVGILLSQVISNVPAAMLLSRLYRRLPGAAAGGEPWRAGHPDRLNGKSDLLQAVRRGGWGQDRKIYALFYGGECSAAGGSVGSDGYNI